jgi:TPR repeat protein
MKRVAVNDAGAICILANYHCYGSKGVHQDQDRAVELYTRAADLGLNKIAHFCLGTHYHEVGDIKKTKFHYEAAAMAGHEMARTNIGTLEYNSGNIERAVRHWKIAASTGEHRAMHELRISFEQGHVNRETINSTLFAYNNSCTEMRSEARDKYLRIVLRMNESTNNI